MYALYLKEVRSFLSSIVGYVFIVIFLIACWLFNWMLSSNMNILECYEFLKDSNKKEPKTLFLILLNKHIFDGE